jgi:phospholipid transport system substrate-binding protein
MKKILLYALSFFLLLGLAKFSMAQTVQDTGKFIENVFNQTISIAQNKKLSDKQKELGFSNLINDSVDTNWIAKFVIGKYWRQISEEQQKEFIDLYQNYLIKTYIPKFKNYGGGDIKINKILEQRTGVFFVQSEFQDNEGKVININFRVTKNKDKLLITDIIPEGISFIATQRSEVNSYIANNGFDGFMKHLKQRQK